MKDGAILVRPSIDNYFLPATSEELFATHQGGDVPVVASFTSE
jgi:hypothetical protein